ncbi:pentapeptide repeat-containing protein [Pseudovibrio denitrificans]|uniref:pentapeptide repeat-containing protein n=1 Tax=Pseudovibrio denitrificans TaxID=258256 RepID=UPI0006D04AD5|nr:pentapeptide repeat-containing protein [Pseudovibrio denitrificans]
MSEIGSFNGKLSFNADDMFWTLAGDAEDNKITLAKSSNTEENQADGRQLFNRYGDELSAIQAPNGLYLVYSEDLKAYTADEERTASPSLFTFEPANTTGVVLIENSDGKDYYVIADNGVLSRTKKTGDALAASIFTTTIVTKSIAEIISQRDGTKIDLTWAYLAGQNLTEIPFYQSTLDHAVLSGATVKSTQFADASLVSANLSNLVCESTNFSAAVLDHAVFTETTFDSLTRLTGASAIDVDFSATRFPVGMSLNNFEASGAVFDGATMAGVVMNGANLTAASMVAVNLKNASFNGADLSGALLTRSNLTGASMQTTQFVNAQLAAADFTDASLSEANFTNANLSNASLINARELTRLDFRGALLVAVDFTGFDFVRHQTKVSSDTDFTRAFLDNCTFTNMDLRGIRFLSASIRYAQMDGVNLEDATLTNADLSFVSATKQVSMIGANLSNAKLEGANLEGVQMGPLITHDDADLALSVDLDRGINPNLKLRLSAGSSLPKVTVLEPGEAWNLTANNCILMVRKAEDKLRIAEVDPHKTGAILTNASCPTQI